jgi:IS5 family transposase
LIRWNWWCQGNALLKVLEPFYPVIGRGRTPYPLEAMLRVHLMQNWFVLSDPGMEAALNEIASLRNFAGLKLSEPIPDETTILNFRHVLGVAPRWARFSSCSDLP